MGAFNINITGVGGHGCERKAKAGDKLFGRCGRFNCPDCMAYDFVQRMKQAGMVREGDGAYSVKVADYSEVPAGAEMHETPAGERFYMVPMSATFTHWPGQPSQVVDDLLTNERKEGQF
jgi:hypothetical protein